MLKLVLFALFMLPAIAQAAPAESVYDRILRTGTIRCGYVVYPPNTMKDPNTGRIYGIAPAIMEKIAEGLSLKLEWTEETGTSSLAEALRGNRFDMLCTAGWANVPRARYVAYSRPIYYVAARAAVRADNMHFDNNLEAANRPDTVIASVDGSTYAAIARRKFPQAKINSHPELTDLAQPLMDVAAGKADMAFAEDYVLNAFMANNPGKIRKVENKEPVEVFHTSFYFNMKEHELRHMIDNALNFLIENGEIDKILKEYETYPGSYRRTILPYYEEKP